MKGTTSHATDLYTDTHLIDPGSHFRNVFIVESLADWPSAAPLYEPTTDLVLTYDYGLKRTLQDGRGCVRYLDHLCSQSTMQAQNFEMYRFFREWHLDENGRDIFHYRGTDFGFSFRIEIWNDFTFYVRIRACIEALRKVTIGNLWVTPGKSQITQTLDDAGICYRVLEEAEKDTTPIFYFPAHRWMDERLRGRKWKHIIRDWSISTQGRTIEIFEKIFTPDGNRPRIFIQEYHPTKKLLQAMLLDKAFRVAQAHFSSGRGLSRLWRERPIRIGGARSNFIADAQALIEAYRQRRCARIRLADGTDISNPVHRIIESRINSILPDVLRRLDAVIRDMDRQPMDLVVMIANLGQIASLVDCVARTRGIPSYLIINGLMGSTYLDEAKYATHINGYSESIKSNYFRGIPNVHCLGDPRMDAYPPLPSREIDRKNPTVVIGASGFRNIDLNSYLAVEFEFLAEVLDAISLAEDAGIRFRVVLKVRPNGYIDQYRAFISKWYEHRVDLVLDDVPMRSALDGCDLFITIYSQTLFEASCMGIPCIYHKTDNEIIDPPFDGKCELVTTRDVSELKQALRDFLLNNSRFDAFLDREVMQKYVGPLDGNNLARNLEFIRTLLGMKNAAE